MLRAEAGFVKEIDPMKSTLVTLSYENEALCTDDHERQNYI